MASRAAWHGPSGFSFESIITASGAGRRRKAAASMGAVITRTAATADAAADRWRNERREKRGIGTSGKEVYQEVGYVERTLLSAAFDFGFAFDNPSSPP